MNLFRKSNLPSPGQGTADGARPDNAAVFGRNRRGARAFTMIEIAISLAIIGFALAAIVGILPLGMSTQKQNREETIINQDNQVLMDAIRNGARGFDDLTNYVIAITNSYVGYNEHEQPNGTQGTYWYTPTGSSTSQQYPLNSGTRIVGLLSTPTYVFLYEGGTYKGYLSNRVTGYFRAMSGLASEKYPQDNTDVKNLAFTYRVVSEIVPYWTNYVDPSWLVYPGYAAGSSNAIAWTNYMNTIAILQQNLRDVRLSYRWPMLARGGVGPSQQSYRTLVSATLVLTNEPGFVGGQPAPLANPSPYNLYFFQPRTYVKSP
jgi:type II secretory pathway pseudopilin PulG